MKEPTTFTQRVPYGKAEPANLYIHEAARYLEIAPRNPPAPIKTRSIMLFL